jgi:colanic acid/amylovoran biosynthesis glycosyltransferase
MCSRFKAFMPAGLVQPDIVHFEWVSSAIEYIPMYSIWRCPIVISCRGRQINVRPHSPNREGYLHNIERAFHQAAAVHCVSEAIRREAMQYGLDPTKAWVIRPAVDPQFFYPPSSTLRQYDCFHIVSTGSLIWRKGYEYALLAIRRLVDMGVPAEFEIIGEGPERQRILYTIDDLGLRGHVHLLGQLSPEQVRERLQQADAFLLSSLSEGISNAVLEAMSCGLPVVTTDCGGMTEVVTNGVEGFVVPVRDPDTMANCLQALWENPELRSAMGAAARERVIREFSLERQIREFLFMYQSVISKWNAQCQATSC